MGDFNINITADDNDCEALLTTLSCIGLHQIIETDTRITSTSASLIDHVYTNNVENITCSGTILTDISDHLPISALIEQPGVPDELSSNSPNLSRSYRNFDNEKFCQNLHSETWESVYQADNVNIAYDNFIKTFTMICDKHAPLVERRKRSVKARKLWITPAINKHLLK